MDFLRQAPLEGRVLSWGLSSVVILVLLWKLSHYGMRPKDYPPGPPTIPLLGNLHQMPASELHIQLQKWAKEYGPIYSLKLGGQTLVVVSSNTIIRDLLEKRSNNYSTRMDMFIRENSDNLNVLFRNNDDIWRRQRRMYHLRLNAKGADNYIPYQLFESRQLLHDFITAPQRYDQNFRRYTASVASTLAYGWRTPSIDIPAVAGMCDWNDRNVRIANSLQMTDWYPSLRSIFRLIPTLFSSLKQDLREIRKLEESLFLDLFANVKERYEQGTIRPSFANDMIVANEKAGADMLGDKELAHNAVQAAMGATDTQWNSLKGFLKAMVMFPTVQKEAQAEIDKVVGSGRMPSWSDRENLPFVRGVVEESLRWCPTTLLGAVPHGVAQDDWYMNYKIPANAGIINNVWTINNDPERFKNPREFDPSRHDPNKTSGEFFGISSNSTERPHFNFGAGRRVCPGFHVAERGLFIAIVRLLWAFKMGPGVDENGDPVKIDRDAFSGGLVAGPMPFKVDIVPRDEGRRAMIIESWNQALNSLDCSMDFTDEYFEREFVKSKA